MEERVSDVREYEGEGIRVGWDAKRCLHAAECVRGLPRVFRPGRRPWIELASASADEVAAVVRRCPTGALTYSRSDDGAEESAGPPNELRVSPGGPVYASGDLRILDAERREIVRLARAALCRCGHSGNKPFCDGSHSEAGFDDPGFLDDPRVRASGDDDPPHLSIRLRADGPLVLEGRFRIEGDDGAGAEGAAGALCRCGYSDNKPFCDGSHRTAGFSPDDPKPS